MYHTVLLNPPSLCRVRIGMLRITHPIVCPAVGNTSPGWSPSSPLNDGSEPCRAGEKSLAFKIGARVGGNKVPIGEGFLPVGLLGKGDEVAYFVDSSLPGKRVERPPVCRGNAESSFTLHLVASVTAFRHLKPTATAWPGDEGVGHPP